MKSTISDNRQLFNVKSIAYSTLADDLAEGEFGIFAEGSDTSIAAVDPLPDNFMFISKVGGKFYHTFDTIDKAKIFDALAKDYQAQQVNEWKTVLENCDCIKFLEVNLNIDEQSLIQRDGLTWTHRDNFVSIAPKELECLCDCTGKGVYDNHIMTKVVYEQIKAVNSPFYDVEVGVVGGAVLADLAAIEAFIAANEAVNTDDDDLNDSAKLELIIKGKPQVAPNYKDLEVNYVYPRGVRLKPAISINGGKAVEFTEVTPLQFEIGAGYDLRAEEFENMSLYTNLNFYPQLSDGIASGELVYQFENNKNYNTITFEFGSKKSGLEDVYEGRDKRFVVCLGVEGATPYAELKTLFGL